MKTRTHVNAGGVFNHNQFVVKSRVKAGAINPNHNEALKAKAKVKAGGLHPQHNQMKVASRLKAGVGPRGSSGTNHNQITVKARVKAGAINPQHNQTVRQ